MVFLYIMKILITGGCGFVGRHFVKRLTDENHQIICVDDMSSESSLLLQNWPEHLKPTKGSLEIINEDCRNYFRKNLNTSFDIIFHLAAIVGGRAMIDTQPILVGTDLSIDAEMFQWATFAKPQKVVYFSSSAAYPVKLQTETNPSILNETMINFENIGVPDMTYGWSKLTGEYLASMAHKSCGLDVVCYRPFSGYGEDQHSSYPFPAILQRCLNRNSTIDIWSDTVRDFVYIDDVIHCVLTTMWSVSDGSSINICTGIATSFSSLAQQMNEIIGHTANVNVLDNKCKGVYYRVGDPSLSKIKGFVPQYSLTSGIKRCIEYHTNHPA